MIFFIVFLRFLAACLITNSHFTGVYPIEAIANGGLLGDVIFFAVSGYCLYNPKKIFPLWYGKRIIRCYLPVLIVTGIYMGFGLYSLQTYPFWWWYLWPTNYHFVASIILLYVPFYFFMKIKPIQERIPLVMMIIGFAYILVYIFAYDKSTYHIDTVREPMIEFLFIEVMLLGAWFRQKDFWFRNKFRWYISLISVVLCVIYFVSKWLFSKYQFLAIVQPINQVILVILLFFIFWTFSSLDNKLVKMPKFIKAPVSFISEMTLEIYVVQYALIDLIKKLDFAFPLNWLSLVLSIFVTATALHFVCKGIMMLANHIILKIKNRESTIVR